MKVSKIFAVLFAILAVAASAAGLYVSFRYTDASPRMIGQPAAARQRVETVIDAICQADYQRVSSQLYGCPELGLDREAADDVGELIWQAFQESQSYELVGQCYATDSGVAQDVKLTCLNMSSITESLRVRSRILLEQRVEQAEDPSEVYDDHYEYREDVVMDVLCDAAVQALENDATSMTMELTMNLVHENGQWWVVLDSALLEAISGGVMK